MLEKYFINSATAALITKYDNYGNERCLVVEKDTILIVNQSPDQIVRESFIFLGNALDGALEGARKLLNKKKQVPVALSVQHGVILFSCRLPNNRGIVWLNNSLILAAKSKDSKLTMIHFPNGYRIVVEMAHKLFQDKRQQASYIYDNLKLRHELDKKINYYFNQSRNSIDFDDIE